MELSGKQEAEFRQWCQEVKGYSKKATDQLIKYMRNLPDKYKLIKEG